MKRGFLDVIKLSQKLKPFSHRPKTSCLIPGTGIEVEVFPALIRFKKEKELLKEVPVKVKGPVKNFTVVQDLEKGVVTVFGEKLFYHILPNLTVKFQKKAPNQHLESFSRLFLGVTKKQDWDSIVERCDFREIFPIWLRMATLAPDSPSEPFSLLDDLREFPRENLLSEFKKLFLHSFHGIMVPRSFDDDYQGISTHQIHGSPLFILKKGGYLIQSLFLEETNEGLHILPRLPPEFFEGRLINVPLLSGSISIEWTKKKIRRIILKSKKDSEIFLHLRGQKKFRVNKEKTVFATNPLEIKSGGVYLLDRFEN